MMLVGALMRKRMGKTIPWIEAENQPSTTKGVRESKNFQGISNRSEFRTQPSVSISDTFLVPRVTGGEKFWLTVDMTSTPAKSVDGNPERTILVATKYYLSAVILVQRSIIYACDIVKPFHNKVKNPHISMVELYHL